MSLLAAVVLALLTGSAHAASPARETVEIRRANDRCFNCHARSSLATMSPSELATMVRRTGEPPAERRGPGPGLYVDPDRWRQNLHASAACIDCHRDADELPHAQNLQPVDCASACHVQEGIDFVRSAHTRNGSSDQHPTCATCHGSHDILPADDRRSSTHPLNVISLCADCHQQHSGTTTSGLSSPTIVASYLESAHGKAITEAGLVVAASCVDCHGSHAILSSNQPDSLVNRSHIPETCGECHQGVREVYETSIHGREMREGSDDAAVCTDCHTAHTITHADTLEFERDILTECGQCHNQRPDGGRSLYETYRMSYHGQVTSLGSRRAARCSDCHGSHDILPVEDPDSMMSMQNRLDTCRTCHPNAGAQMVSFEPHADHTDRAQFPVLYYVWLYFVIVISTTFALFGIHSVLWFVRSLSERNGGAHHAAHGNPKTRTVKRFSRIDRINHIFVIITFFGLTLTGMPLLFADEPWAGPLVSVFGGVHVAGIVHRIFGVGLIGNFLVHMAGVVYRIRKHGVRKVMFGPNSLLPRWRDMTDAMAMIRWFLGGKRPTFDHWTYWEKFDYWAEIFGTFVIGGTGLLLWFASEASHFVPGWMFNVASIVHGYEALLAVGFIFSIHFFNAHLRPGKFPVDDVIFTGVVSEHEFKEERGEEYERLAAAGEYEQLLADPPPKWRRTLSVVGGVLAMTIGTAIVVLIILAGLNLL